jgi:hypothetical protein
MIIDTEIGTPFSNVALTVIGQLKDPTIVNALKGMENFSKNLESFIKGISEDFSVSKDVRDAVSSLFLSFKKLLMRTKEFAMTKCQLISTVRIRLSAFNTLISSYEDYQEEKLGQFKEEWDYLAEQLLKFAKESLVNEMDAALLSDWIDLVNKCEDVQGTLMTVSYFVASSVMSFLRNISASACVGVGVVCCLVSMGTALSLVGGTPIMIIKEGVTVAMTLSEACGALVMYGCGTIALFKAGSRILNEEKKVKEWVTNMELIRNKVQEVFESSQKVKGALELVLLQVNRGLKPFLEVVAAHKSEDQVKTTAKQVVKADLMKALEECDPAEKVAKELNEMVDKIFTAMNSK